MWSRLPLERMHRIFGEDSTRDSVRRLDEEVRSKKLREYSYKVSGIANKRVRRLEETGLESPAYRHWLDSRGGRMFGIRGLDDDGVVMEIQEGERFNNMITSNVTGASRYVKDIGDRLGLDGDRLTLQERSGKVFAVTSKLDQYLRTAGGGDAVGSDKLQQYVSSFIQRNNLFNMETDDIVGILSGYDVYGDIQQGVRREIRDTVQDELGDFGDFLS